MKHRGRNVLWVVLVLTVVGGAGLAWYWIGFSGAAVTYRTVPVARGDLLATIGATGSLEPEEAVDVGAQVDGQISRFGTEGGKPDGKPIDRRSFVKTGDLLALVDPSLYKMDLESTQAQLAQSNAQLAQSKANLVKAEADIQTAEAKKTPAEQDWVRVQKLKKETPDAMAATTYDNYQAVYLSAVANVASANAAKVQAAAAIDQAKAAITQAQASVDRTQRNLDYCTITSPVDGVVIDRRVNIGQTVVSKQNAPSLFLIAKDLTRMEIWVSVNEADIGSIHNGQSVTFTVDARPGVTFVGTVTKVRFDASMTQNVVTYPVEVSAMNPDGLLYPYMTANVQFELDKRTNVLKVPNAALQYTPLTEDQVAPQFRAEVETPTSRSASQGASGRASKPRREGGERDPAASQGANGHKSSRAGSQGARKDHTQGLLWVQEGQFLRPITVRVGLTDGTMTEVQSPDLKEGLEVVVSQQQAATKGGGASPFMPQMRRR